MMALKQTPNINKLKFKRFHKYNSFFLKQVEKKDFFLTDYEYGIQSLEGTNLTYRQLESCRRALRRGFGKKSKIKINVSLIASLTKKPVGIRMGKGKGGISQWVAPVKKGKVLFEVNRQENSMLKTLSVLKKVQNKLPIKTKILKLYY